MRYGRDESVERQDSSNRRARRNSLTSHPPPRQGSLRKPLPALVADEVEYEKYRQASGMFKRGLPRDLLSGRPGLVQPAYDEPGIGDKLAPFGKRPSPRWTLPVGRKPLHRPVHRPRTSIEVHGRSSARACARRGPAPKRGEPYLWLDAIRKSRAAPARPAVSLTADERRAHVRHVLKRHAAGRQIERSRLPQSR